MRVFVNLFVVLCIGLCLCSCEKKPEKKANFIFSDQHFTVRQTHAQDYSLDVKGKIKNTSDFDVKRVVVTAYCKSCTPQMIQNKWWVSGTEKMPNQKSTISYLAAGGEADFSFQEVAFYFTHSKKAPDNFPENIEFTAESYDIVED